jgi:CMP-N,N'-diacetyllegionaminic acid synthase
MKILSIIPARKNSKRIKNKNKILLKKKKLIEHTFLVAKKSKLFDKILLTTDDKDLIRLSKKYNILAPWLRPKSLSGDFVPSYKAILHAYDWYEKNYGKVDGIFILQPTSPFRTIKTLKEMIKIFIKNKKKSVINVSRCNDHPEWMLKLKNNRILPYISKKYFTSRSQSLAKLYKINGLGYLINPSILKKEKTLIPKNSIPCINKSKIESIDIDDMQDYLIAKKI